MSMNSSHSVLHENSQPLSITPTIERSNSSHSLVHTNLVEETPPTDEFHSLVQEFHSQSSFNTSHSVLHENSQPLSITPTIERSNSSHSLVHTNLVEETPPTDEEVVSNLQKSKKNLTNEQRLVVYQFLLKLGNNERLKSGSISRAADQFSISRSTVKRIWKRSKENQNLNMLVDVSSKKATRVGRKRIEIDLCKIPEIPLRRRTNIRSLAVALDVSHTTLHRRIKEGLIRPHSNAIKPYLTDENKKARLDFCLSMMEPSSFGDNSMFKDMFDCIHIDEKWFYMTKTSEKYYLLPDEVEPLRTCKSKRYISKIMFLAAVARPRYDSLGNEIFSGKIGIFPFVFQESAKRKSKNRSAGTLETKPILSVTKDIIRSCLIEKVLPEIRAKWPTSNMSTIFIQQDNAKPHIESNDVEFVEAAKKDGFDIRLKFQPPNSPDMNVLDLGFFRAIQSLQHQEAPNTIDELVSAVEKSFNGLSSQTLNSVFLTLQLCMLEVLKVRGGNNYKLPHFAKHRLERNGNLPIQIEIDNGLVTEVLEDVN